MIDMRWIFLLMVVMGILGVTVSFFLFKQCKADGYNNTQCYMMISADRTNNVNVFGINNPPQKGN